MTAFETEALGVLGKARHQAEFLRAHDGDPVLVGFDGWLTDSVEWAAGHGGPAWTEAFAHGAAHAFAFRPRTGDDRLVAGVMVPSADSAGRRFPLVAAASTRLAAALVGAPELLPLVLEALWSKGGDVLAQVLEDAQYWRAAVRDLRATSELSVEQAAELYSIWAGQLPLAELWALLGPPLTDPGPTLRLLLAAVEPCRGVERPETRLTLRLPLGRAGGVALCFWIDLVRRALGWRHTVPSFFWTHDGEQGSALLHLGAPPRATLAELFLPTGARDELCDLTQPVSASLLASLPPLSPDFSAGLADPARTVASLLAGVS